MLNISLLKKRKKILQSLNSDRNQNWWTERREINVLRIQYVTAYGNILLKILDLSNDLLKCHCCWVFPYGQNTVGKNMKSSKKIIFRAKLFFLQFSGATAQIFIRNSQQATCLWLHTFQKFSWNFPISQVLRKLLVVRQLLEEILNSVSPNQNLILFHFWWSEAVLTMKKSPEILPQITKIGFRTLTLN